LGYTNGEIAGIIIFFIGFVGLLSRKNILKTIICVEIMESAIILYFISSAFVEGGVPPIVPFNADKVADPLPQALMITEIVIGIAVSAVALTMFIHMYHKYGTTNWQKAMKKRRNK
jgi:multicomponent Na+:H+ antiporter subunit C